MKKIALTAFIVSGIFTLHAQNVGIGTLTPLNKLHVVGTTRSDTIALGTSTPRSPLSFGPQLGQKITLWDDGNVAGNNYGIGVQSGVLQMHSFTALDDISFGYGRSTALNERMRIINSGADGLLLNGRIHLKNGTFPNDPANGPGIWLYKPDNLGQLLGFIGAQDNQNMGFYGGPNAWGLTYNTVNSRVGIGKTNPTSLLDVNGQITIDQKSFGGYGGLLVKGNVPGSNHPNIAFTVKNNAGTPTDVVGAMLQGDLINNTANAESIDLTFLTANSGFGSLSEKFRIKGNGALAIGGSSGNAGQFLTTNGNSSPAVWTSLNDYITTVVSGTSFLPLTGNGSHDLSGSDIVINLARPAKVMLYMSVALRKLCLIGTCDSKAIVYPYVDGAGQPGYRAIGINFADEAFFEATSSQYGPDVFDLAAGSHTFSFTGASLFNNPEVSFKAKLIIISN